MTPGRAGWSIICALSLLLTACDPSPSPSETAAPLAPNWRSVNLPTPQGDPGRVMLRDAVACGGVWYVVGAIADDSGDTRPAAWKSDDGQTWHPLATSGVSYYGKHGIFYSAACREGRLATISAKSGGAHGNPRISPWQQQADGSLKEFFPEFLLFGGPDMVSAGRLVAGPESWMIVGNRRSGAAVWNSADASLFTLLEGAPQLSTDERGTTWAFDILPVASGWLVAGSLRPPGRIDGDPMAWTSPDGVAWSRMPVPGTEQHEEIQRLAAVDGAVFGLGVKGDTFATWRLEGDEWTPAGDFGARGSSGVPGVLSVAGDAPVMAAVSSGTRYELWITTDGVGWRPVMIPAGTVRPSGESGISVAAAGERVLLLVDDGETGRVWLADLP